MPLLPPMSAVPTPMGGMQQPAADEVRGQPASLLCLPHAPLGAPLFLPPAQAPSLPLPLQANQEGHPTAHITLNVQQDLLRGYLAGKVRHSHG
jgi:hypothetical protein